MGGDYSFPHALVEESRLQQLEFYTSALNECIKHHPVLSVTIQDAASNQPKYSKLAQIDLSNHFQVLQPESLASHDQPSGNREIDLLNWSIEHTLNGQEYRFADTESKPAWVVNVMLYPRHNEKDPRLVLILLVYSHAYGDGLSGVAFHKTFQKALQKSFQSNQHANMTIIRSPTHSLPDQPDTASSIPISWSCLLNAVLGPHLPASLRRILRISGTSVGTDDKTWTGSNNFTDALTVGLESTSSVETFRINAKTLRSVLTTCKRNGVTLTPLLNHLISQALSSALLAYGKQLDAATNFVSQTPVNLRRALGVSENTIGNYAGVANLRHDFQASTLR